MTPEEQWEQQANSTAAKVIALVAAYEAAKVTAPNFSEYAAAITYGASVAATRTADVALALWQASLTGLPTLPLGLTPPPDDLPRLVRSYGTVIATPEATPTVTRAERIARSEPWNRGRQAYQEGLRARGVENWRRIVKPDACDSCAALARDVVPMDVDFFDHPNCRCTLAPEVPETWADRVRAEQLQLRQVIETDRGPVRLSTGLAFS